MDQLERFPPENLAAAHFTTQQAGQAMTCLHDNTVEIPAQRQKALELVETSLWTVEATLAPFAGAPER